MSQHLASAPGSNLPEYAVSEISGAIKRTLEGQFEHIRVRGELSAVKFHSSGHVYATLKDDRANLSVVCWRGNVGRLSVRPEDGMEVIATGRISAFAGQSRYQLVIEALELAGEGALLKLLEERRKKLAAEGLFEAERKRPVPYLPTLIGVVTSPTGAVIRDILHRLAERFPRPVLLWPVPVQGETAADRIAAAIAGFDALAAGGPVPRPDVLIVGRGGGSLEDLMPFNEEAVVRAAAACTIPVISAVGHETDTTLLDFVADHRAPTPTAAAERAVPVRHELIAAVADRESRLLGAVSRLLDRHRAELTGLGRGLGAPERRLEMAWQTLDERADRLGRALRTGTERRRAAVQAQAAALRHPRDRIQAARQALAGESRGLQASARTLARRAEESLQHTAARLRLEPIARRRQEAAQRLTDLGARLERAATRRLAEGRSTLDSAARLLEGYSYRGTLARGYVLVQAADGAPVKRQQGLKGGAAVTLRFYDGARGAIIADGGGKAKTPTVKDKPQGGDQGQLF